MNRCSALGGAETEVDAWSQQGKGQLNLSAE